MQHSPMLRILGMVTWAITALVSINVLTAQYDYDFIASMMGMMSGMMLPMIWLIGIAGLISLAMFIKVSFMSCCGCAVCPCSCNSCSNHSCNK